MRSDIEARLSLLGALRLAGFRADGVRFFDNDVARTRRSFRQVLPMMLMGFIALALLRPISIDSGEDASRWVMAFTATNAERGSDLGYWIVMNMAAQIVKWAGFLVLAYELMKVMGHGQHIHRFIQIFNWMLVVRMTAILAPLLLTVIGLITLTSAHMTVIAISWLLITYQFFAYRVALNIPWHLTLSLVMIETIMSVFIGGITLGILHAGAVDQATLQSEVTLTAPSGSSP